VPNPYTPAGRYREERAGVVHSAFRGSPSGAATAREVRDALGEAITAVVNGDDTALQVVLRRATGVVAGGHFAVSPVPGWDNRHAAAILLLAARLLARESDHPDILAELISGK
jgi:hypothetical protein